ncbi:MAG: PQQ-binding-like beta-propeller repeat protein [Gemmatimonadota bacterium]|uniref:outer membrane protein assembly factor BamB family protein n=1 Tax=Candidatus Palauibacter scopulicola TaxID=3056741 RepID=UPI0023A4D715|nr:PQQ-binding-like beta-propeller repeat protein [Candidatus Palauibacter scopulicola]MDE2664159.1 PQQ-binding-like beta-propeller repeat protein [Candidatus Palauibacter scopulicola]
MKGSHRCFSLVLLGMGLGMGLGAGPSALAAQSGTTDGEWRYWAGDAGSTRYAPLAQIDASNVADLEIAWRWQARNFGRTPEGYYRVTPLYANGVLYATAGFRRAAVAIDPETGETLWMYRLDEGERGRNAPRGNSGRGVGYWTDGAEERVLLITPAYHMVSLDAKTGLPDPAFGEDGIVDLKLGLGREVDLVNDRIGSSSPPVVVGDVIVVGAALPQGGRPPTKEMPPGHVRGFDARTGEQLWTFHTIPQPGDPGHETWEEGSWDYTGNAAVWTPFTADLDLGYVYLPVEAGTGDYYGGHRPGDNLYSQSLVCVDASTGEVVWYFQTVHHGIWDFDPPAAPVLMDITVDGREIPAVAQVTKQAFTYVFDRVTGEPVWPIEERPVPAGDVPGEWYAPTQPFPTLPVPFDMQGATEDDLIDLTPELKAAALEIAKNLTLGELFTPPTVLVEGGNQGTLITPGSLGGANWPGAAYDPETQRLFVGSATRGTVIGLVNDPESSNMRYIAGRPRGVGGPQGLPILKPPWGRISALDMNTGQMVWQVANDHTPSFVEEHPALEGVDVPRTGRPSRAGLLATRTLLFAGTGGGTMSADLTGLLRAHDKETGEILAEIELPSHQTGVPMTYMHDGRQYIVAAIAGRGVPAELVALRLPG